MNPSLLKEWRRRSAHSEFDAAMIKIFDNDIRELLALVEKQPRTVYAYDEKKALPISDTSSLIMLKDTAFELGGSDKPCASSTVVTDSIELENKVIVIGRELNQIKSDCSYARLVLISLGDAPEDEQGIFDLVKALEYAKYKENVEGFMMRASTMLKREQVRVSRAALKKGLCFEALGATTIKAYLSKPSVKAVSVIFIADSELDFAPLQAFARHTDELLKAFNHILDNVLVDCAHCSLKQICDEVEGMRELHLMGAARLKL